MGYLAMRTKFASVSPSVFSIALVVLMSTVCSGAGDPGNSSETKPAASSQSKESQAIKLIGAVLTGVDTEAIQKLLDDGIDANARSESGLTAYNAARLMGETEVAQFLANRGVDTNVPVPPPEKLVDSLFAHLYTNNAPGASVLVAQNGKILFEKGYGLADVGHGVAFSPETKSRIGSITKQFTASAILKLQEQGKLSINDKLSKYFPDFPRGDEVTLHHLLTHTSGIHSYTDKPGFMDKVTKTIDPDDLIKSFKNDPYDFDPGKKWHYDNSGYFLLGRIIEKVSGQSYGEFLRGNFFKPLGMNSTGVHRSGVSLDHEATGYEFAGEKLGFTNALNWDMSQAGAAGSLYSTVGDLFRWNEGIFGGKLLKDTSLKAAWTPVKTEENKDDDSGNGYGYGWFISKLRGAEEISHGGGLNGFSSFITRLPRENFTVVVLANALPGKPGIEPALLAHLATQFFLGEKLDPRPSPKANLAVSAAGFDGLVGRYDYGIGILTVTKEGSRLYAQLGGQPRYEIFPRSETEFFWKAVDAQVTFVKDKNGKVTKAVHHQGGQVINAPRLEDLTEVKVDPAGYDALVGKYDYGGATMTISRDGDRMFAQLAGQPKFEIFPKSPTEFFWKVVDAQVEFVKNDAGKVTKAIHHQSGQTLEAPRIE
jgi:CubicO group peptidase (beta-lactamase class C family)